MTDTAVAQPHQPAPDAAVQPDPSSAPAAAPSDGIAASDHVAQTDRATATGLQGSAARSLAVTIVVANTFEFDSRFLRTATTLAADGHRVTIVALAGPGLPREEALSERVTVKRIELDRRIIGALRPLPGAIQRGVARLIGLQPETSVLSPDPVHGFDRVRALMRRSLEILSHVRRVGPWRRAVLEAAPDTDVFHCQSLIVLPVVRGAAKQLGARFVYDVADFHTEAARLARMPWMVRALVRRRERGWARDASGFLAVSEAVAKLVERRFQVPRPAVLLNCPPAWRPEAPEAPHSTRLRDATGIAPDRPLILYQGGFSIDRGVEELVAALDEEPLRALDATAVFLGYGRLQGFLEEAAAQRPGRLFVLPAVPPDGLLEWTASADVSFVGQPPRTLNQRLNLPNKLFESLMAGVPVVVSTGNEHCRLVSTEAVGRCATIDDPRSVAEALAELLRAPEAERQRLRAHCRSVALARYTWEGNAAGLIGVYRRLADSSDGHSEGSISGATEVNSAASSV